MFERILTRLILVIIALIACVWIVSVLAPFILGAAVLFVGWKLVVGPAIRDQDSKGSDIVVAARHDD